MNLFNKNGIPRRVKFVDQKQQTRFAFEILVMMVLFPLLFYVLVTMKPFSTILLGKNAEVLSILFANQIEMIKSVWWVVLFVLIYVMLLSILMSHKIFGPIYRLKQAVQAKLNGDKEIYCKLRKGDYFMDFADLLGKLLNEEQKSAGQPSTEEGQKINSDPQA